MDVECPQCTAHMEERPHADMWYCPGCGYWFRFTGGDIHHQDWALSFGAICPIPDCNLPMEHYGVLDNNDCWGCTGHQEATGLAVVYFYDSDLALIEADPQMLFPIVEAQMQEQPEAAA